MAVQILGECMESKIKKKSSPNKIPFIACAFGLSVNLDFGPFLTFHQETALLSYRRKARGANAPNDAHRL